MTRFASPRLLRVPTLLALLATPLGVAAADPGDPIDAAGSDPIRSLAEATRRAQAAVSDRVVRLQPIGSASGIADDAVLRPSSGVVWDDTGRIITSSYGLDPRPEALLVTFADGRRASGRVVAIDQHRGLALVRVEPRAGESLPPLATNDWPRIGETAIAIGRTFRADRTNLSVGIISALNRLGGLAIQTDAAASPANYGGPLVDLRGRVIGVLTPLAPRSMGGGGLGWYDSGIAFAVPTRDIAARIDRLDRGEDIEKGLAGWSFAKGSPFTTAPKLGTVYPTGPAAKAGLRVGDVVQAVNERPVETVREYRLLADRLDAGDTLRVRYQRGDEQFETSFELTARLRPYSHPYLGVRVGATDPEDEADAAGLAVIAVFAGSPAATAGLQRGDTILQLSGSVTNTREELSAALATQPVGGECSLQVATAGDERVIDFTVGGLAYSLGDEPPAENEVTTEELAVIGAKLLCGLHVPAAAGPRPTLIWLGGELGGGAAADLASYGILVATPPTDATATPVTAKAYVDALRRSLAARDDFDQHRLAIGGGKQHSAVALALGLQDESQFAGVVVGRSPRSAKSVPLQTPDGGRRRAPVVTSSSTCRGSFSSG